MTEQPQPYVGYADHLAYIADAETRDAFLYLVAEAQNLREYTARPNPHGYMSRTLHYYDAAGQSPFAFAIAQKWLLFNIRKPQVTHPSLTLKSLLAVFPSAKQTKQNEFNFKVRNLDDARSAMQLAFGLAPVPDRYSFPDEVADDAKYYEGSVTSVKANSYERNPKARAACIAHYGYSCCVCGFDFRAKYGELGSEFIHVHHLVELSSIGATYQVDPVADMRPVCPNCHAMLHRTSPPLTIQQLRRKIAAASEHRVELLGT